MKHPLTYLRRQPALATVVLLAGGILLVETGLAIFGPESTMVKEHRLVLAKAMREPAPDLLIMGDSVARESILVSVLQRQLGDDISIRNDGLQGTGPEIAYFTLQREVDAGRIPRAILYAPSAHTFSSTRMHIAAGGFCTWPEVLDLLRSGHDRKDILGALLLRVSYTVRYREQIKALITGHREVLAFFSAPVLDDDVRISQYESTRANLPPVDFSRQALKPQFRQPFAVAPVNKHYLDRFLGLAERHGVRIYWVTPPCMKRAWDSREQLGFNSDYYSFLDSLTERPGVTLLQREFLIYPDTDFYDQIHFDIPACQRFSAYIAERLSALDRAGRGLSALRSKAPSATVSR